MYIRREYVVFINEQYCSQHLDWGTCDDTVHSGRYLLYLRAQTSHNPTSTYFLVGKKNSLPSRATATAAVSAAVQ